MKCSTGTLHNVNKVTISKTKQKLIVTAAFTLP